MTPALFVCGFAALLGLAIGSFLNVVAHRVPAGIPLTRESRCPSCDHTIAWWRNVPVLGWLLLRGKCADCGAPISARYPIVEAFTGLVFAAVTALWWHRLLVTDSPTGAEWIVLVTFLGFAAVGIALALIDLDTRRLPDVIVLPSLLVGWILLTVACLFGAPWQHLVQAVIGSVVLWGFYALVRFVRPDGMGGGDVKLAAVVGGFLGWVGWGALAVGGFAPFLIGTVVGVGMIVAGSRHASPDGSTARPTVPEEVAQRPSRRARPTGPAVGRRTALPFGPMIIAGAWVGIVAGEQIGRAYWRFAGL